MQGSPEWAALLSQVRQDRVQDNKVNLSAVRAVLTASLKDGPQTIPYKSSIKPVSGPS